MLNRHFGLRERREIHAALAALGRGVPAGSFGGLHGVERVGAARALARFAAVEFLQAFDHSSCARVAD